MRRVTLLLLAGLMVAAGAVAQSIPTATLRGKVIVDGDALPGVTVTADSPSLQGQRSTVTSGTGDYLLPFLPPGDYTVTFVMDGMVTRKETLTLTATRTDTLNVELALAAMAEEITVTGVKPMTAPIEATEVSTTFQQELINELPVGRNLESVTLLAAGVNAGGPGDNIIISGAMSFDSLYLINGTIANENLRGQPHDLFIEDAIQETTVMSGGISAEYGHFTGGVVNMLTKSGGNEINGSFRTTLRNESWTAKTPLTTEQEDKINPVYEATFGGAFWRDRLWFFTAARYAETGDIRQTRPGLAREGDQDANGIPLTLGEQIPPITYPHGTEELRLEAKLTAAITTSHRVTASYLDVDASETNQTGQVIMDLDSLVEYRETPNSMYALNYNGVLTDSFFLEAQYSKKEFAFLGSGSPYFDLIKGTLIQDRARGTRYWSPTFRANPDGERRDHELYTVKGSYFLSTESFGTHELKAGYEYFNEVRAVNNYQNGSDYRLSLSQTIVRGDEIFPRVRTGSTYTRIYWYPIFVPSDGSNYASDSIFLNDRWVLNKHWTFNLGVRYDKNDAVSGDGQLQVAKDSALSPRFSANWDVYGTGRLRFTAGYGQYVGRLAEGVGNDGDPAGRTATFNWVYRGPAINNDVNTPTDQLVSTEDAIQMVFDWFFANGGTDMRPFRTNPSVPGLASILDPSGLTSPNVKEWTLGFGLELGSRGFVRADVVYRNWDDFYAGFTNMDTGRVDFEGIEFDKTIIGNDNDVYDREYTGLQTQFRYRITDRFNIGGTYTLSKLVGNVTGESSGSGPTRGSANEYPEYREASWDHPMGYLTGDRRHRAKLFATYDLPTGIGDFNFSLVQSFESGTRTSADVGDFDSTPYVENPGYLTPDSSINYFFGGRGNLISDDITRTDLSLNYTLPIKPVDVYIQLVVFNIFNEQGVTSFDDEVLWSDDEDYLAPFNPFTETPIECPQGASPETCQGMGANWQLGPNAGLPDSETDYQAPRSYRIAVGIRF